MNHSINYSVKMTHKGIARQWPTISGEIMEGNMLIGTFHRPAMQGSFVPPIAVKFYSEGARNRFLSFADSLSVEETVEALLPRINK